MSGAETVVDVAQIGATAIAAGGLLLTASQVRSQNTLARLERVSGANEEWTRWRDDPKREKPAWDPRTVAAIRQVYTDEISASTPTRFEPAPAPADGDLPWLLGVLLPARRADPEAQAPRSEPDYRRLQDARAANVMHVLRWLRESRDAAVKANVATVEAAVRRYIDHLSSLAEKYEFGMLDRVAFLGKYHRNLVQAAFHLEPYILANNALTQPTVRNGMRILALGEAAREFHWHRAIQRGAIRANAQCEELGWVIGKSDGRTPTGLAWLRHRIKRSFTAQQELAQPAGGSPSPRECSKSAHRKLSVSRRCADGRPAASWPTAPSSGCR
jgi:hypothetical protein